MAFELTSEEFNRDNEDIETCEKLFGKLQSGFPPWLDCIRETGWGAQFGLPQCSFCLGLEGYFS